MSNEVTDSAYTLAVAGLRVFTGLTSNQQLAAVRELTFSGVDLSKILSTDLLKAVQHFTIPQLAKKANYLKVKDLRLDLELSGMTFQHELTDAGRKYGKMGLEGTEWYIEVIEAMREVIKAKVAQPYIK